MKTWLPFVLLLSACSKALPPAPLLPLVSVTHPLVKDIPIYQEYIGHVEANMTVSLKSQVSGVVLSEHFTEGQEVLPNDLLVTIDPRPFQAALNKAKAQLAQNLATYRQAKEKAVSYEKLLQQKYISKLDFDQLVTEAYTAESLVKQSQAEVDTAELNLSYCYIKSPIKGMTSRLEKTPGNYVETGGDTPLLTINQVTPVRISFYAPEKDLSAIIQKHQQSSLQVEVYLNETPVHGQLFLIDNHVDPNTGMILLQAKVSNEAKALWPGEFVRVRLILENKPKGMLLPTEAVQLGQEGAYVFVVKPDMTVEQRNVILGQKDEQLTLIEKGILPEDLVVLQGQINLYPGAHIEIKP